MIFFKWELTGFNNESMFAFGTEVPCAKKQGVFYPDASNLEAICAFNPKSNKTMTVREFRTLQNLFCGGWHEKVNQGWTLIKSYRHIETYSENTNSLNTGDSDGDRDQLDDDITNTNDPYGDRITGKNDDDNWQQRKQAFEHRMDLDQRCLDNDDDDYWF